MRQGYGTLGGEQARWTRNTFDFLCLDVYIQTVTIVNTDNMPMLVISTLSKELLMLI